MALPPASAAPKITVTVMRQEIGDLVAGDTAEVQFPVTNTGTEPLTIKQVDVSCGCMTTHYPGTLKPGEKGVIAVKLVSNPLWNGPTEKHVTVLSNDPEHPVLALHLAARMQPLFRFTPWNPASINYQKGNLIRQVFTVTSTANPSIDITGVTPGPGAEARLLPVEASDQPGVRRVEVSVRPPAKGGNFASSVTLQTTHRRVPTVPIVIYGVSQDTIAVTPPVLYLSGLDTRTGTDAPYSVILSRRVGTFRVLAIQTDSPALHAEIRESVRDSFYMIALRYQGGWKRGRVSGKIVVTTDDPTTPMLEVPYEATVD